MNVNWIRYSASNQWCSFLGVNLADMHFNGLQGIYIIWQGGGSVVKMGQGVIKDRIRAHRSDPEITIFPKLYVTWAHVSNVSRNGIERYLGNTLNPNVGDKFPDAPPIRVNLPWS